MALTITNPSLKAITVQVLTDGFAERDITPTTSLQILPNNPEDWATLPCVTVQQLSDAETNPHIGDSLADQHLDDDIEVTAGQSTLFTQTVEIRLWCKKAMERDRLGLLLKEELFRGRGTSDAPGPFIATDGLDLPKISGGHDEEISDTSKEFAPYSIFARTYILSALTELTIQHGAGPGLDTFEVREDSYEVDLEVDFPTASQP